ncbi:MAG: penicillin-binding protein activator [Pseudomonadaceae bacterium]|nr:penicillin-binding protein activator [Pseudomonadaceae bacterium]
MGARGWGIVLWAAMAGVAAAPLAQQAAPAAPLTLEMVDGRLREGAALVQSGEFGEATTVYQALANINDRVKRAQARFGLAVALTQQGQDEAALKTLEGTPADDTELGQAVGDLRGRLMLQLAEKSLLSRGTSGRYLSDYARLTVQPDNARAARLNALEQSGGQNNFYGDSDVLRVGVLLPLSGPLAAVGQDILRGLQLALDETPAWRGVRVELYPHDTTEDPRAALDGALVQGARVIVGPLLAANVKAVGARAQTLGVPVLAFSSDRTVAGGSVHVVPPLPTAQARLVARWALAHGSTQLAALIPSNPYGYEVFDAFRDEVARGGGQVVTQSFFNPENVDLGASVRQLVKGQISGTSVVGDVPFNALFVPVPPASVPLVTSQLAYYDLDRDSRLRLLGTALWQDNAMLAPDKRGARGGVFAAPAKDPAFVQKFEGIFGHKPNTMALQGFDVGRMLVQVAAERQWSGRDAGLLLNRPEGFYGSGGYLRFTAMGLTERGMETVEVGDGTFKVVAPALTMAPLPVPAEMMPSGTRRWGGWW